MIHWLPRADFFGIRFSSVQHFLRSRCGVEVGVLLVVAVEVTALKGCIVVCGVFIF